MRMFKIFKDKVCAMTLRKLAKKGGYKTEIIKLDYPKGQYLLYMSGG